MSRRLTKALPKRAPCVKHRLTAKEGTEAVDLAQHQPKLDTRDLATVEGLLARQKASREMLWRACNLFAALLLCVCVCGKEEGGGE